MGRLSLNIPPFASDYSGVCSALFDLDCFTAINDARCCTSNYVFYDEPRWRENVRPIFCTTLRNVDAILGNDEKVIARICEAARTIETEIIAVVGTPVPAITGMDMRGIAAEIEARTAKPAFGFDATGFKTYDEGLVSVGRALIDRFALPRNAERKSERPHVNILGMSPFDYGAEANGAELACWLEAQGFELGARFFMGLDIAQIRACAQADVNLAVSGAGVRLAEYLERKFGIPWVAGFPIGEAYAEALSRKLHVVASHERTAQCRPSASTVDNAKPLATENTLHTGSAAPATTALIAAVPATNAPHADNAAPLTPPPIFIVSDQILGSSLRCALECAGTKTPIRVMSFFSWSNVLAQAGDAHLKDEFELQSILQVNQGSTLVADPVILGAMEGTGRFDSKSFPHLAVSGRLSWKEIPSYMSIDLGRFLSD